MSNEYRYITTKSGRTLAIFFNTDTSLLVIDLVDDDEQRGNEFIRMTVNEPELLSLEPK